MNKLISVIIPIYNVEEYLERCIQSVINQTYKNLEIILVDDGSPDNCGKICDEYVQKDSRIKVIHKRNGGVSSARNAGLDIAQGDYISFIDSDDYINEDMYEILISEIQSEEFDIVECNYINVYEDGIIKIVANTQCAYYNYRDILYGAFSYNLAFFVLNKLFKRSIINNIRFNTRFQVAEDMLFFFECTKNGAKIKVINNPLYNYLQRQTSVMNKPFHRGAFDILSVLEIIKPDCKDEELLKVFNYYYLKKAIWIMENIVAKNVFVEHRAEIRKTIIANKEEVFKNSSIETIRGVGRINKRTKLYVLLLWMCPRLLYRFYPLYIRIRKSRKSVR